MKFIERGQYYECSDSWELFQTALKPSRLTRNLLNFQKTLKLSGNIQTVRKLSTPSRTFSDFQESLVTFHKGSWVVEKMSILSEHLPDFTETLRLSESIQIVWNTLQTIWKLYRLSGNFENVWKVSNYPESFWTVWKHTNFLETLKTVLKLNRLSGSFQAIQKLFILPENCKFFLSKYQPDWMEIWLMLYKSRSQILDPFSLNCLLLAISPYFKVIQLFLKVFHLPGYMVGRCGEQLS